jgi:hypothetical protein
VTETSTHAKILLRLENLPKTSALGVCALC